MTKSVAVARERLGGLFRHVVLGRQRRQQREADQRLGGHRAVRADRQRAVAFAAPDRLDTELDRGGARGAGGRQRDRQAARAELIGEPVGDRAELRGFEYIQRVQAAGDFEDPVGRRSVLAGGVETETVGPVELDRRRRKEKRSAEIIGGKPGFANRLVCCSLRHLVGQRTRAFGTRVKEIDGAADARVEMVGRKAGDWVDAGTAGRQRSPVVLLADAERSDDADAGNGDEMPSEVIFHAGHILTLGRFNPRR